MFNGDKKAKSGQSKKETSFILRGKVTKIKVELLGNNQKQTANNYHGDYVVGYIQRLSLSKKMAILAIAITILPTLAMGAIAYGLAHKSMTKQINQSHQATATKLTEQINRLILGGYKDVQIISQSPFFTNTLVKTNTTIADQRSFLDNFVKTHKAYDSIAIFDNGQKLIVKSTGTPVNNHSKIAALIKETRQKDTPVISQPEKAAINITAPVKDAVTGQTIAVVIATMPLKYLTEATKNYSSSGSQYYLLDSSGQVFLSSETELLDGGYPDLGKLIPAKQFDAFTKIEKINHNLRLISYVPSGKIQGLPDLNWQLVLTTDTAIAFTPEKQLWQTITIVTVILALVAAAMAVWLAKAITQPILNVGLALSKLAEGELDTRWHTSRQDEFKVISNKFNQIAAQLQVLTEQQALKNIGEKDSDETLQKQLTELLNQVEMAANGDLTVRADVTSGVIGTVADFFNSIVESLRDIVIQVKETATEVNTAIGDNESAISQLAEDAVTQAAEINRTLDAVDQMTNFIKSIAENAQEAAIIANNAAHTATKTGEAMDLTVQNILCLRETVGDTAKKVKRLGESSQQISRVVSLINQIATQTNLLAINASIEAARAGEEGQGFAVVAEEVGELAIRSASATQEIEQIVANIQRETNTVVLAMEVGNSQVMEGTQIVEEAKQSLGQILEVSRKIDFLLQSISTATASQLQTSQAVSELMQDIAAIAQRTSESSHVVSKSLHQTVEISQELQKTITTFKVS